MNDIPTKGDPIRERLMHAFGSRAIHHQVERMMYDNPLLHLTDEARAELVQRLLADHKFARKIRTSNRRIAAKGYLR